MLTGCASQPAVLGSKPLWPFEEIAFRTSVGTVTGYVSRPEGPAERLIVVLQTSPCPADQQDAGQHLATGGLVWKQFKDDSFFLQFERPGGGDAHSVIVACDRADRHRPAWQDAVADSVTALRRHERLDVPTFYVGIGRGATTALTLAARDTRASSVALLSGMLDAGFAPAIEAADVRSHLPPVLILHAADDRRTPLTQAEQTLARLGAKQWPAALLIFEGTDSDFGLQSSTADCFDLVAQTLGERVRKEHKAGDLPISRIACPDGTDAASGSSEIQIEHIEQR
ncbi:MAG TPA: hypothetical protein PKE27_11060 [Povalibacter sp.]|uniref:hypothetical protein n=1 Tax=Povalibacter sp. TaxID=1962978 RepID=UPI002CC85211|nr:hypothetical protein [Povalibacter sp.]HMN45107.1 hypothetical protein [Povalibacter sp.]